MLRTVVAVALFGLLSSSVLADGGVKVALPDVADLVKADAITLLDDLVRANVASSNCTAFAVTDGEWSLITGTADLLAASLGIDTDGYDRVYYKPAFHDIDVDQAGFCDAYGPNVKPLIDRLVEMGGSTAPVGSDQDGGTDKPGKDKLG
jgi:hypothetical protein